MSELTVPRAPTTVGRIANVDTTPVAASLAGAVADFGDTIMRHGMALEADRLDRQMSRRQLDMTRDLGELRLQVEDMGDPDAAGQAWDQGYEAIRQRYLDGTDERGRPLVDPRNKENFNLAFDDLGNQHALAIGRRQLGLRQSQRAATYYEYGQVAGAEAARTDPETRAALYVQFDAETDKQVAAGTMTPEQAAKAKVEFRQSTENAAAIEASAADPSGFLEALDGEAYKHLDPETKARYRVSAQAELARRQERASNDAAKVADARLKDITALSYAGERSADAAFLDTPQAMASPLWAEAMAARSLRDEFPGFKKLPPAQQEAIIAAEASRAKTHDWELKRGDVLRAWYAEAAKDWVNDPGTAAQKAGLEYTDLPVFDPAAAGDWSSALAGRIVDDEFYAGKGYTKNRSAIFTSDDLAGLKAVTDPKADAAPKVALAGAIVRGSGGKIDTVLNAMGADPVFRRSVKLLALTGDPNLTEAVLRGEQKIALGTVVMPSDADLTMIFNTLTGGVYEDAPEIGAEVKSAVAALYADEANTVNGETEAGKGFIFDGRAREIIEKATFTVTGAAPDRNGKLTIGGLQEVNGALVVLPRGVDVRDVELTMDRIAARVAGGVYDPNAQFSGSEAMGADPSVLRDSLTAVQGKPELDPMAVFRGTSARLYGKAKATVPDLGANPREMFQQMKLSQVGESGIYEFVYERDGRLIPLSDASGRAWRFRLTDLMDEAAR